MNMELKTDGSVTPVHRSVPVRDTSETMMFDLSDGESSTDRAVSPVVGVALLIAITVILAAVIGFVVLDTTVSTTDAPSAQITFEGTNPTVITHEGGDQLEPKNVVVRVTRDGDTVVFERLDEKIDGDFFNTGTRVEISNTQSGDTVFVFWEDPQSSREVQLAKASIE